MISILHDILRSARMLSAVTWITGSALSAATVHINLSVTLDPARSSLRGMAELSTVAVGVPPLLALRDDMTIDAIEVRRRGARHVLNVRRAGTVDGLDHTLSWRIPGYRPAPGDRLSVRFHGGGRTTLNHHIGPDAAFTSGGSSAWYPAVEGRRTIGRVRLDMPRRFTARTSAPIIADTIHGDRRRVIFVSDHPTYFAFAAAPFAVRERLDGVVPVDVALLKDRPDRGAGMRRLAAALGVEEKAFGRFPFASYGIVEVPAAAGQAAGLIAASFESFLVVRSDFLDARGFALPVLAHEAGHQWWPGLVGRKGRDGDYMMDEALAQYAAYLAIEEIDGAVAGRAARRGEDRPPIGGVRQLAALAASGSDRSLTDLPHAAASYDLSQTRGALVYWQLAALVGPSRFHAALQGVARDFAYDDVDWPTMAARIIAAAPEAVREEADALIHAKAASILDLDWAQESPDLLKVEVRSNDRDVGTTITVGIEMRDGTRSLRRMAIAGPSTSDRWHVSGQVAAVTLDPAADAAWIPRIAFDRAQALDPYARAARLWNIGQTAAARTAIAAVLAHLPRPDANGVEFLARSMLGEMMEEAGDLDGALAQYRMAEETAIRPDDQLSALYAKIARAAGKAGRPEVQQVAIDRLAAAVAATGLGGRALARYRPSPP